MSELDNQVARIEMRLKALLKEDRKHMIKKGQMDCLEDQASSAASKFYTLAF